jgi:hypothetical protein
MNGTDEHPDVLERLSELGRHLDAERDAYLSTTTSVVGPNTAHRRSRVPLVAATILTMAGVATLAVLDRREDAPTASQPSPTSTASGAAVEPVGTVVAPIDWQRAGDLGSLARSQVAAVTAGPGGFVATGMGFDDGRNQGRVWYSPDGLVWQEPALELFDAKSVGLPVALGDAYYVVAQSNPDRLGRTEGTPGPADAQLYRSTDGLTWEPWGEPWGDAGSLASTGRVLLRSAGVGSLQWSDDGLIWNTATFPDGAVDGAGFDMWTGGVIHDADTAYLRGFVGDEFVVWSSTNGSEWHQLPAPPAGGNIAAVPDGLIIVSNPRETDCANLSATARTDARQRAASDPSGAPFLAALDAEWSCTAQPDIYRYDTASATWSLTATTPDATPIIPAVTSIGTTVIAPVVDEDRSMTIWTAPIDSLDWQPQPNTRIDLAGAGGSPGIAAVAASDDTAIVITTDHRAGQATAVLVGHRQ